MIGALAAIGGGALMPGAANATPGVPGAPTVLYQETFENLPDGTMTPLNTFTGTGGMTYTADPDYLNTAGCNGLVMDASTPASSMPPYCSPFANNLAQALGLLTGNPTTNAVLAETTTVGASNPSANDVAFETKSNVPLPSAGRFVTVKLNAAATSCQLTSAQPAYTASLVDPVTGEQKINTTPINPCTDPGTTYDPATTAYYGSFTGDQAALITDTSMRLRLRNAATGTHGNDAAFDNVTLLDVTPTLDKSFNQSTITAGGTSTMTFTVTNTSELASKSGFSFTDNLPAGTKIAATPNFSSDCAPASITSGGTAGATSVAFKGSLATNQVSCTFKVDVTADNPGTYVNAPNTNVTNLVGLNAPQPATLTVVPTTGTPAASPYVAGLALAGVAGLGGVVAIRRRRTAAAL